MGLELLKREQGPTLGPSLARKSRDRKPTAGIPDQLGGAPAGSKSGVTSSLEDVRVYFRADFSAPGCSSV